LGLGVSGTTLGLAAARDCAAFAGGCGLAGWLPFRDPEMSLPSRGEALVPSALNNQLRTGADKGNPTV
jgi:hypothetical protein